MDELKCHVHSRLPWNTKNWYQQFLSIKFGELVAVIIRKQLGIPMQYYFFLAYNTRIILGTKRTTDLSVPTAEFCLLLLSFAYCVSGFCLLRTFRPHFLSHTWQSHHTCTINLFLLPQYFTPPLWNLDFDLPRFKANNHTHICILSESTTASITHNNFLSISFPFPALFILPDNNRFVYGKLQAFCCSGDDNLYIYGKSWRKIITIVMSWKELKVLHELL